MGERMGKVKRRIPAGRYRSMLYPDITGYRGASLDVSQTPYLLQDVLKAEPRAEPIQARLSEAPVKSFGWDWCVGSGMTPGMTLGEVVERCILAYGVLFDAVDVALRVTQGIEQAEVCSEANYALFQHEANEDGMEGLSASFYRDAVQWDRVRELVGRIAARKSAVGHQEMVRARATLRYCERSDRATSAGERASEKGKGG